MPSIYLANAQSLVPNLNELCVITSVVRPSIIIICETWLTELVTDSQVSLPNYSSLFRKDRCDGRRGGGVAIFVHDSVFVKRYDSIHSPDFPAEDVWIILPSAKLLIIALYIPPNLRSLALEYVNDELINRIEDILDRYPHLRVIIAGDLNNFSTKEIEDTFNLLQVVPSPTRGDALLDKVMIDESLVAAYKNVEVGPSLGNSDHRSVLTTASSKAPVTYKVKDVYDFRRSHLDDFRWYLRAYPWHTFFAFQSGIEEKCEQFYKVIQEAITMIPRTQVIMTEKDKPWITPLIKLLINKRYEAFRRKDFNMYNHYKDKVKHLIEETKKNWLKSTKNSYNGLWKICRDVLNLPKNTALSSLLQSFTSSLDAAEAINKELCKNFSEAPDWDSLLQTLSSTNTEDWNLEISEQEVASLLKGLKLNKSSGNDDLSPKLLSEAHIELAAPICHLISLSVRESVVPTRWKAADVTPVPKKRNPAIEDLRPISILPTVSKVMEKCVLASLKKNLLELYGPLQFGFRPKSSTELAHIRAHDFITKHLDDPTCMGVIILSFDMQKAFDCLRHDSLLLSLADGKLPRKFILWCASFLQNRTQRVRLNDSTSSTFLEVTSGVPQGSILAPFLFSTHVRSLNGITPSSITIKYADDVMTLIPLTRDSNIDVIVKNEVSHVGSWCNSHGMRLNVSKTKQLLCKKQISPNDYCLNYPMCRPTHLKILGIIYDEHLNWNTQIEAMTKKANQKCFLLRKLKQVLSKKELTCVYNAFILSSLEYCSALLVGISKKNSEKLEKVRRKCHRIVCGRHCRCDAFTPLYIRRLHHALTLLKSMKQPDHLLHDLLPPSLSHSSKFLLPSIRTKRRHDSFLPFCISLSNRIGDSI